ncbi:MAG: YkgJ family cysteine cluster protein [Dehalococcoidales bacterium]|nr:YkgJ family cysteine cluster protein [Dehalococcoidales bacterium]
MTGRTGKRPGCSMCGLCCIKLGLEMGMTPDDYRRWKHQGRDDILRYAYIPLGRVDRGYLWFDPENKLELDRCPFLVQDSPGSYSCAIQETKPKACSQFWCEWAYGVGERAIPFKVAAGWTDRARRLGYGKSALTVLKLLSAG